MKKAIGFLGIFLLLLCVMPATAQIRFGVKGGANISSVHFNSELLDESNVTGFHIGPMIETTLPILGLGMDAAILYTQKGVEINSEAIKVDYIDIPVHLKGKFGVLVAKVYVLTGPYFGFRVGGDKVWDIPGSVVNQVKAKSFGMGWDFGAGVELFSHLQVGFNYGLGLTNNYTFSADNAHEKDGKNRGWAITAAILF